MAVLCAIMLALPLLVTVPTLLFSLWLNGRNDCWLLAFIHVPAALFWLWLIGAGYGAQSLGNLAEGIALPFAIGALAFLKVVFVNPRLKRPAVWTYWMVPTSLVATLLLRSFMPLIPE